MTQPASQSQSTKSESKLQPGCPSSSESILEAELESLIKALEAEIPANPDAERNQKHSDHLEAEMKKYFRALMAAFPYRELELIYAQLVPPQKELPK
jgi:hypothetical protein